MTQPTPKGIIDLYDIICDAQTPGSTFYEWILPPQKEKEFTIGQLCLAPVWYEKKYRWYFIEGNYLPLDEKNSTWKARKFIDKSTMEKETTGFVKFYFELEKDEHLLSTHGKFRPVILLKKQESNWNNPTNTQENIITWLCLPLFTYKQKHNQQYILEDQRFNNDTRIYIPPAYKSNPGINNESAADFKALQSIKIDYLVPLKCLNPNVKIQKPFKICDFGLKIILFHYMYNIHILDFSGDRKDYTDKDNYLTFKEMANELIDDTLGI